jgi:hypothetical protein
MIYPMIPPSRLVDVQALLVYFWKRFGLGGLDGVVECLDSSVPISRSFANRNQQFLSLLVFELVSPAYYYCYCFLARSVPVDRFEEEHNIVYYIVDFFRIDSLSCRNDTGIS